MRPAMKEEPREAAREAETIWEPGKEDVWGKRSGHHVKRCRDVLSVIPVSFLNVYLVLEIFVTTLTLCTTLSTSEDRRVLLYLHTFIFPSVSVAYRRYSFDSCLITFQPSNLRLLLDLNIYKVCILYMCFPLMELSLMERKHLSSQGG